MCEKMGAVFKEKGLFLVGVDFIGEYLSEINVTSPTCIRQIDKAHNVDTCELIFDLIEKKLKH